MHKLISNEISQLVFRNVQIQRSIVLFLHLNMLPKIHRRWMCSSTDTHISHSNSLIRWKPLQSEMRIQHHSISRSKTTHTHSQQKTTNNELYSSLILFVSKHIKCMIVTGCMEPNRPYWLVASFHSTKKIYTCSSSIQLMWFYLYYSMVAKFRLKC